MAVNNTVYPYLPALPPTGFDRADGLASGASATVRLGTATPDNSITADYAGTSGSTVYIPFEELADSPTIERGEQATITHTYRCSWQQGLEWIELLPRGVVFTDSIGRLTKVLTSSLQHEKADTALLTVVSEGISFDNPPDQFAVVPVELGVNILKHPRYFYALMGNNYSDELTNQMVIRMLQNYFENMSAAYRDALSKMLWDSMNNLGTSTDVIPTGAETNRGVWVWDKGSTNKISGTDMAKRAALEIIQKYWRNIETPYLIGYQLTYTQYFWLPQYLNPGGYIEDPISDGGLPSYYWSPSVIPTSENNIFSLVDWWNPQCYSTTGFADGGIEISWLRKADEVEWERTWFKVTKTWMGSAVGFWDTELYTSGHRPQNPNDYLVTAGPGFV